MSLILSVKHHECFAVLYPPKNFASLTTDACDYGWAAVLTIDGETTVVRGGFPPSLLSTHITVKELYAVYAALLTFRQRLVGIQLLLYIDNQPAMYMLRKFSTKSTLCFPVLKDIVVLLRDAGIWLDTAYVTSASNLADAPSRKVLKH